MFEVESRSCEATPGKICVSKSDFLIRTKLSERKKVDRLVRDRAPGVVVGLRLEGLRVDFVRRPGGRLLVAAREVVHQAVGRERRLRTREAEDGDEDMSAVALFDRLTLIRVFLDVRIVEVGLARVHDECHTFDLGRLLALEEELNVAAVQTHDIVVRILAARADAGRNTIAQFIRRDVGLPGLTLGLEVRCTDEVHEARHELFHIGHLRADRVLVERGQDLGRDDLRGLHNYLL